MSLDPIIITMNKVVTPTRPEFLRRFCIVSNGLSNITKGEYKVVDSSSWSQFVTNDNYLKKWLNSFFVKAIGKTCVILEIGSDDNAEAQLKKLEAFIDGGTYPCYKYSLPHDLYADNYLATLLTKYNDINQSVYFSAITSDTDPTQEESYNNWKGKKSFIAFYPSLQDTNLNIDGIITGIMASSSFDISSGNPMNNLWYKETSTLSKTLDSTLTSKLIEANAMFSILQGSNNIVVNAVNADGEFWYAYYSIDILKVTLQSNITTLLYNSSNTSGGGLTYNDAGVETIKQNVITTLESLKNQNVVDIYARSYDLGTSQPVGVGDITTIPVATYKVDNPDNFKQGIYGGISFYTRILRFIRQILININLE